MKNNLISVIRNLKSLNRTYFSPKMIKKNLNCLLLDWIRFSSGAGSEYLIKIYKIDPPLLMLIIELAVNLKKIFPHLAPARLMSAL